MAHLFRRHRHAGSESRIDGIASARRIRHYDRAGPLELARRNEHHAVRYFKERPVVLRRHARPLVVGRRRRRIHLHRSYDHVVRHEQLLETSEVARGCVFEVQTAQLRHGLGVERAIQHRETARLHELLVEIRRNGFARCAHLERPSEHVHLVRKRPEGHHDHPTAVVGWKTNRVLPRHLGVKLDVPEVQLLVEALRRDVVAQHAPLRLRAHALLERFAYLAHVGVAGLRLAQLRRGIHESVARILQRDALHLRCGLHERLVHRSAVVRVASAPVDGLDAVRLLKLGERRKAARRNRQQQIFLHRSFSLFPDHHVGVRPSVRFTIGTCFCHH